MWQHLEEANYLLELCRVNRSNHIDIGDDVCLWDRDYVDVWG
jgi:hypothetical protein